MPEQSNAQGLAHGLKAQGLHSDTVKIIPKPSTLIRYEITWEDWPTPAVGPVLELQTWISFDNEATWHFHGGVKYNGGEMLDRDGVLMTIYTFSTYLPPEQGNIRRRVKHDIICNEALTTGTRVKTFN